MRDERKRRWDQIYRGSKGDHRTRGKDRPVTEEEQARMQKLRDDGWPCWRIADLLGRYEGTVSMWTRPDTEAKRRYRLNGGR